MKKIFATIAILFFSALALTFSASKAPAESVAHTTLQKKITTTSQTTSPTDEQFSQFFCLKREDASSVRTAYVVGGDTIARGVANKLVNNAVCGYRATVFNAKNASVACENLANGYCIAIQPVFTCKNDESSCDAADAIPGFDLEIPKVATGVMLPINTEAMAPVRTLIFNQN